MVCHPSFALSLSLSLSSIILSFLSLVWPSFPQSCHVLFYSCCDQRDRGELGGRGRKPRGRCPRLITTPSARPSFPPSHSISALHLSIFLSDSWPPVGYSGHASLPGCIHLPTDLRKRVLVGTPLLYLGGWSDMALISAHLAWRPLKHTTLRPPKMNPLGDTWGPHHKTDHFSWGPFSWSLKNNYMWTDSKSWWTLPIRRIKKQRKCRRPSFCTSFVALQSVSFVNIQHAGLSSLEKCKLAVTLCLLGNCWLLEASVAAFLNLKDKTWTGQKRSGCSCRRGTMQGQAKNRGLYGTKK